MNTPYENACAALNLVRTVLGAYDITVSEAAYADYVSGVKPVNRVNPPDVVAREGEYVMYKDMKVRKGQAR